MNEEIKERIDMINRGEVPKGYKKTKVGIIPEDWEVKRLEEIAEIISGGTPSTTVETYWNGEIPWCTPTDITSSSKYIENTTRYISEEGLNNSSAQLLPANSILMCSRATIGPRSINKIPMTTNQGFKSFVCKEDELYFEFLYYLLEIYVPIFIRKSNGSTFLEISKRDTQKTEVAVPRLSEQQKIAQILSTWGKAIELKKKLIEEKKEQKKGLMQRLLTGEVRLPGFEGEWEEVRLGDVATMSSGGTPRSTVSEYYDGDIPWVSISDMTEQGKYVNSTAKNISKLGLKNSSAKLYPKGTVLYAMYASIGECSIATVELSSSQAILGIQVGKLLNNEFLFYYLISIKEKLKLQGQQGTQSNLNAGMVRNLKIPLPEIDEQIGIVRILLINDKEIDLLNQELEQLKEQKKGLMQLLLTGKIRVSLQ